MCKLIYTIKYTHWLTFWDRTHEQRVDLNHRLMGVHTRLPAQPAPSLPPYPTPTPIPPHLAAHSRSAGITY